MEPVRNIEIKNLNISIREIVRINISNGVDNGVVNSDDPVERKEIYLNVVSNASFFKGTVF